MGVKNVQWKQKSKENYSSWNDIHEKNTMLLAVL
jgi:hypothetical protein